MAYRIKRKHKRLTKAEVRRVSGGKYWIMGRETDEHLLNDIGVVLGPKQVDSLGRVKRAKGLVVWGQCTIPDIKKMTRCIPKFMWGADCPDHIMKDRVRERGHTVAEVDWLDEKFRKEVEADEEPNKTV